MYSLLADVVALKDDIRERILCKRTHSFCLEYNVLIAVDVVTVEDDAHALFCERYSTIMLEDAVGFEAGDLPNILKSQCPSTKKGAEHVTAKKGPSE